MHDVEIASVISLDADANPVAGTKDAVRVHLDQVRRAARLRTLHRRPIGVASSMLAGMNCG